MTADPSRTITGVDGCRAGGVAATHDLDRDACALVTYPSFATLLRSLSGTEVVAVDMPIGLSNTPRAADRAARRFLGPRRSSVFPAPCRAALGGGTYLAACGLL